MSTSQTLDAKQIQKLIDDNQRLNAENAQLKRSKEKFGLSFKRYPEQGEAELINAGKVPYLVKKPEYSTIKDAPQKGEHLLLEGDNLSALIALQATHKGKVDVIYIDPPYNTGNKDFVYNDSYVSNDDGFRHSKWLSFMERRLVLAKELLSETGVIFVSIDDNEQAALKLLMDSVFGSDNLVANLSWVTKNGARGVPPVNMVMSNHEYVLCYGVNKSKVRMKGVERSTSDFSNPDDDPRGLWRSESIVATGKQNNYFTIADPATGNEFHRNWAFSRSSIAEMIDQELIIFPSSSKGTPRQKKFFDSYRNTTKPLVSYLGWFSSENSSKDLMAILGRGRFDFPKPTLLVSHLIGQSSHKDSIVLDFFAGSGTTGHAVAALNAEDGGNRQCILVTNNFEQDGSPNGIARDVTAKRMEAVLTGKWADGKEHEALPGNLHYCQIQFADPAASYDAMESWADKYAGLASVAENSYREVQWRGIATTYPALSEALKKGDAALTANADATKAVLVWQDESVMDEGNERVEQVTQEASEWAGQHDVHLVFYVPSSEGDYIPDDDFFEFDNSTAKPFPIPYIDSVNGVVKTLKGQGLLVQGETIDDSEGDEGRPDPQESFEE